MTTIHALDGLDISKFEEDGQPDIQRRMKNSIQNIEL
jgi:hypothetical protein